MALNESQGGLRPATEKQTQMRPETKVITISELSEYLRVHRSTLYRLLKKGELPGFKIGSDWRFNVEAIDKWRLQQQPALDGAPANQRDIVH